MRVYLRRCTRLHVARACGRIGGPALAFTTEASRAYRKELGKGVRQALSLRDKTFGDYREREKKD